MGEASIARGGKYIEADEVQRIADPRHRPLVHTESGEVCLACHTDQKEPVAGVDHLGRDAQIRTVRTQPDRGAPVAP